MRLDEFAAGDGTWADAPFSVVAPGGVVWTVATDRSWLFATVQGGGCARFAGPAPALFTVLGLLRADLSLIETVSVPELSAWAPGEEWGSVAGVPVNLGRLRRVLGVFPEEGATCGSASHLVGGAPCLALAARDLRVFLMGVADVPGGIPSFVSGSSDDDALLDFLATMDEG